MENGMADTLGATKPPSKTLGKIPRSNCDPIVAIRCTAVESHSGRQLLTNDLPSWTGGDTDETGD